MMEYHIWKSQIELKAATFKGQENRNIYARSLITGILKNYWHEVRKNTGITWRFRSYDTDLYLDQEDVNTAKYLASYFAKQNGLEAGFQISSLYSLLIHPKCRSKFGIFYTPNLIVNRTLKLIENNGFDFQNTKVIDPASGGSAFLGHLAHKMLNKNLLSNPDEAVSDLANRLVGYEIDNFAAWVSQTLLECELALFVPKAKRPPAFINIGNALNISTEFFGQFDLVIGNPPYGKISLNNSMRKKYNEVLYGHVNNYQLFFFLSTKLTKEKGLITLITPTSYIGGEYFKKLRKYLASNLKLLHFEFIDSRKKPLFYIQQDVLLTIAEKSKSKKLNVPVYLSMLSNSTTEELKSKKIGTGKIDLKNGRPWILPRSKEVHHLLKNLRGDCISLNDLGYISRIGNFVWNRNKERLSQKKTKKTIPLMWSEVIGKNGEFIFPAKSATSRCQWVNVNGLKENIIKDPVILIKRTTNIDQPRRIYQALIPGNFLDKYKGVIIENHVNYIIKKDETLLEPHIIASILGTNIFDMLFRCVSGTTAVSSSELNFIPFPPIKPLIEFQNSWNKKLTCLDIEYAMRELYGVYNA